MPTQWFKEWLQERTWDDPRKAFRGAQDGTCKATCKREFKLPWREAGPPNHHDDKVDSDQ